MTKSHRKPKARSSRLVLPDLSEFDAFCTRYKLTSQGKKRLANRLPYIVDYLIAFERGLAAKTTEKEMAAKLMKYCYQLRDCSKFMLRFDPVFPEPRDFEVVHPVGLDWIARVSRDLLAEVLTQSWIDNVMAVKAADGSLAPGSRVGGVAEELQGRPGRAVAELLFLISRILRVTSINLAVISRRGRPANHVAEVLLLNISTTLNSLGIKPSANKASKFHKMACDLFEMVGLDRSEPESRLAKTVAAWRKLSEFDQKNGEF